jgi:DNA-binding MarR family transcriptional regulator
MAAVATEQTEITPAHTTVLIARLSRVVRQRFEQSLAPLGLRQRELVALSYLRGHGPTAQQALAERLCLDPSSTVCLLNALEDDDLVIRRRDRSDRRRALVGLSPKGERVLADVDKVLEQMDEQLLYVLDDADRCMLHSLLARLEHSEPDWSLARVTD